MTLSDKIDKAIKVIRKQALLTNIIVGLSYGKDSLALCQLFRLAEVKPKYFHMYFMPNLRIEHELAAYCMARFDIKENEIYQYPSEHFILSYKYGYYTYMLPELKKKIKVIARKQLFAMISKQHKACICTGVKKSDGIMMQRLLEHNKGIGIYPLMDWTLQDVLTFLKMFKIDLPPLTLKGVRGVGLADEDILFMNEYYPDDIERIAQVFPFIKAVIYKYKYYNLTKKGKVSIKND